MDKKAVIIVNPVAGKKRVRRELYEIISSLTNQDYETVVRITKRKAEAIDIAEKFCADCDPIVCCGGDGTLNEVISGILKTENRPRLLYYPCGSTNDFAATLGLPKKIKRAVSDIDSKKLLELDIGVLNGEKNFSYITSFGIFTNASFSAPQKVKNVLGHLAYLIQGAKELPNLNKSYHTKITYDGGEIEGDFALVAVTNSTSAGGVLRLPSDLVRLNDGLFEILLIKGMKTAADTSKVVKMLLKQKYDGENIIMIQSKHVHIECPEGPEWCTDGEFAGNITSADIECKKGAVRILI